MAAMSQLTAGVKTGRSPRLNIYLIEAEAEQFDLARAGQDAAGYCRYAALWFIEVAARYRAAHGEASMRSLLCTLLGQYWFGGMLPTGAPEDCRPPRPKRNERTTVRSAQVSFKVAAWTALDQARGVGRGADCRVLDRPTFVYVATMTRVIYDLAHPQAQASLGDLLVLARQQHEALGSGADISPAAQGDHDP